MDMYSFVPRFRDAKFCGVPSCVFDKLGCAAGEKWLRDTALVEGEKSGIIFTITSRTVPQVGTGDYLTGDKSSRSIYGCYEPCTSSGHGPLARQQRHNGVSLIVFSVSALRTWIEASLLLLLLLFQFQLPASSRYSRSLRNRYTLDIKYM
jgi:hypothetical protein